MKITYAEEAFYDLQDIFNYISLDNINAAQKVREKLLSSVELVATRPFIGRPTRFENIREWKVINLPYLIPYRLSDDDIEILRFYHTARNRPQNWRV